MSETGGFSATWLSLREGADHRARNAALGEQLARHLAGREVVRVLDLGAGTGSNLRACAPLLGPSQEWELVDNDPALLEEAARCLARWADDSLAVRDSLVLSKGGATIGVYFRLADLSRDLDTLLAKRPDLVTASALFDLASADLIQRLAQALAAQRAAFFTVLTYDGRDSFLPPHTLDDAVGAAFAAHMQRDKGLGLATGAAAPQQLSEAFRALGYRVETGDSPWVLTRADSALARELLTGIAGAVSETGAIAPAKLTEWLAFRQQALPREEARLVVGHTDLLALP